MQLVGFSQFLWEKMGLLTRVADPDPHYFWKPKWVLKLFWKIVDCILNE
jgi:hypothetical protein